MTDTTEDGSSSTELDPAAIAHWWAREPWFISFGDRSHEWRRLFSEVFGTFLLVLVAVGSDVSGAVTGIPVSRAAAVAAPALMVTAIILFMGKIGGAHLNPVVSVAFALRQEFPWRRVPGYIAAQLCGGLLACVFLWAVLGRAGSFGVSMPDPALNDAQATLIEAVLTLGLVSTILGTASSAQNVGPLSALAVGGYIALAGIWAGALSGASMNPVRSFAPALVRADLGHVWVYIAGPAIGMLLAVGIAYVLRGPGADRAAILAAQGELESRRGRHDAGGAVS